MKFLLSISNDMDFMNSKKKLKLSDKSNSNFDLNLQNLIDFSDDQKQMFFKQQKKLLLEKQYYDQFLFFLNWSLKTINICKELFIICTI